MSDDLAGCNCIIDTHGLHALAKASGNIQAVLLDQLSSGIIAVPACVWTEFSELYESEVAFIDSYVAVMVKLKPKYHVGAARVADVLNSGFSHGAYDSSSYCYAAAIAYAEDCCLLTDHSQLQGYARMECAVIDLESWFAGP